MKGATEELFVKVTYYKKRESLGSPQWHFTMHIPQCFFKILFWKKKTSEKHHLNFSKNHKNLERRSKKVYDNNRIIIRNYQQCFSFCRIINSNNNNETTMMTTTTSMTTCGPLKLLQAHMNYEASPA